jgi:hypothetical protein
VCGKKGGFRQVRKTHDQARAKMITNFGPDLITAHFEDKKAESSRKKSGGKVRSKFKNCLKWKLE